MLRLYCRPDGQAEGVVGRRLDSREGVMRRRLLLAGAGALGLALPLLPVARAFASPADDNSKLVYRYLAGWNFHDVERAASCLADDVVYLDSSVGTPVEGKEAATT